jgi:hypothetical protein
MKGTKSLDSGIFIHSIKPLDDFLKLMTLPCMRVRTGHFTQNSED